MAIALVKERYKNHELEDKLNSINSVKPLPKTEAIKEAEEIARELDTAGREKVVYRLSKPIIEKIEDNAKLDSIAKIANTQASKISAVTQINGQLSKENTDLKRVIAMLENGDKDTVFRYSDQWFSAEGFRKNDTIFSLRNITADISVNKIDHSRKKNWLIGRNENVSTVYFNSPYARVNGLSTMTIKQKEPLVDFKVKAEGKYLHGPKELLIGPKLQLKIGRFGLSGGYYLNPGGKLGNTVWYGGEYSIY